MRGGADIGITEGSIFKLFRPDQIPYVNSDTFEVMGQISKVRAKESDLVPVVSKDLADELYAVEYQYALPPDGVRLAMHSSASRDPFDRRAIELVLKEMNIALHQGSSDSPELTIYARGAQFLLQDSDGKVVGKPIDRRSTTESARRLSNAIANFVRWRRLYRWRGGFRPEVSVAIEWEESGLKKKSHWNDPHKALHILANSKMRLSVENRSTLRAKFYAVLLRPDYSIEVCPLGVASRNDERVTEWISIGASEGPGAWKIIMSSPEEDIELAFIKASPTGRGDQQMMTSQLRTLLRGGAGRRSASDDAALDSTILNVRLQVEANASVASEVMYSSGCIGISEKGD